MSSSQLTLRTKIAAAAARLIVESGLDYGVAKRKAAKQLLHGTHIPHEALPDNFEIEAEVRLYHQLFFAQTQPVRLLQLRTLALQLMEWLSSFNPFLKGAVLNGTAGEHTAIEVDLFSDDLKALEILLIDQNIPFDISQPRMVQNVQPIEIINFIWKDEKVHLTLYEANALRAMGRVRADGQVERVDAKKLAAIIDAPE